MVAGRLTLVAADATRVGSPTFSRLASNSCGSAQQLSRVAPLKPSPLSGSLAESGEDKVYVDSGASKHVY